MNAHGRSSTVSRRGGEILDEDDDFLSFNHESEMKQMKRIFTASLWREGDWFVAQCIEIDVASQGATEEEAIDNLRDALNLHFTPPVATIMPQVRTLEIEVAA